VGHEAVRIKRRAFLVGSILVAAATAPFGRRYLRGLEDRAERVVRTLCDHFLPGHDGVPGAVARGVDREIVTAFRETRRGRLRLLLFVEDLTRDDFLEVSAGEQRAIIGEQLARASQGDPPRRAEMIEAMYRDCVTRYYTNSGAWSAIRYRTPQPHGYPDYTECRAS